MEILRVNASNPPKRAPPIWAEKATPLDRPGICETNEAKSEIKYMGIIIAVGKYMYPKLDSVGLKK